MAAWLAADGIDPGSYRAVMKSWFALACDDRAGLSPIRALELGECTEAEFSRELARQLVRVDGGPVPPGDLLGRMFAGTVHDLVMHDVVRSARQAGLKTALLSNSWGGRYPREKFAALFDAVVISAEVGMRKPEERIFRRAAELIGLDPASCVFVDDVAENVAAARAAGLVAVHHHTAAGTAARLTALLGIPLPAPGH